MTNRTMMRCSILIVIRKMKIKIIVRYYFIITQLALANIKSEYEGWRKCKSTDSLKIACRRVN